MGNKNRNQVQEFIRETVEGYLTGVDNDPEEYPVLTMDQFKDYVWETIEFEKQHGRGDLLNLRFLGKQEIMNFTEQYLKENVTNIVS